MNKDDLGKFFLLGFPKGIKNHHLDLIRRVRPAGVMLYPSNMENLNSLQINMERLYEIIDEGVKFFISSDHEGGQLETVPGIFPSPGNKAIGSTNNPKYAYDYGEYLGKVLKKIGFNMLFAPVLDVLVENASPVVGLRAYSKNEEIVSSCGNNFIKGLEKNKIIATCKHFPGHGKAVQDSHYEIPVITDIGKKDIYPFEKAIELGTKSIMTAHILYPTYDEQNIATLSKSILKDFLRDKLKYKGIIISDAIEMKAIHDNYSTKEIVNKFYSATGDILLVGDTDANFEPLYNELQKSFSNGEIEKDLMEESYKRILSLQDQYINTTYETRFLAQIAEKAIYTNIQNNLDVPNVTFVLPNGDPLSPADTSNKDYFEYKTLVKSIFESSKIITYDVEQGTTDTPLERSEVIISFVVDSSRFKNQLKMQKKLKDFSKEVIYIILRNENDLDNYQGEKYILTNSTKPISIYYALKSVLNLPK